MKKLIDAYSRLLNALMVATVAILVIPVSLQIISRYTQLIPSYIWTEELSRFLFIWMVMLGAMVGIKEGTHFEVDIWPELGRRGNAMLKIVSKPVRPYLRAGLRLLGDEIRAIRLVSGIRAGRAADAFHLHRLAAGRRDLGSVPSRNFLRKYPNPCWQE
jgi:hypothetical protein